MNRRFPFPRSVLPGRSFLFARTAVFLALLSFVLILSLTVRYADRAAVAALKSGARSVALSNRLNETARRVFGLRTALAAQQDSSIHIAVSLDENLLFLMRGNRTIRTVRVSTGSGKEIERFGKKYEFKTPTGVHTILKIEKDPVWVAPDWYWIEKGETVPEGLTWEERKFPGVMGEYAFRLGHGYAIHGTKEEGSLGQYVTHGCIRVGKRDLRILRRYVKVGTKVYIY
ncbi:MAG: L,D-transpeptidase [Candidatus Hydrogenedentota bacterium]|nr:MAG: L,D-transpeptidase [Candidatus Hydrogenedentota bacterium]